MQIEVFGPKSKFGSGLTLILVESTSEHSFSSVIVTKKWWYH